MKKRNIVIMLVVGITSLCTTAPIMAVTESCTHGKKTFNDKKILSGVGNYGNNKRYYWINSNFSSNYSSRIRNAFSYWINTSSDPGVTTSISFRESSNKSDATIELHTTTLGGDTTGKTDCYSYSTLVDDQSIQDWTWNIIYIDTDKTKDYGQRKKTGLVGHEIGHAMGLSHQPNKQNSSIMYNYDDRYILSDNGNTAIERNKPAKVDCNNINHIYK